MRLMRTPRSVDLSITARCNLKCSYCSHFTSAGDVKKELDTDEWLQFFQELNRCAVTEVCLQGGEPFLRPDFEALVQGIASNRMRFSVLSNGTLITDRTAAFLAGTKRCDSVQISIDGSIATTHDAFRGKGNFIRALEGLKLLRKHDISTTVRVTIHRRNVSELGNIARFLLVDLALPEFSTNSASHFGLCRKNSDQVQLTVEERSLAMKTLLRLSKEYEGRISAQAGPLAEVLNWREMELARRTGKADFPYGGYLTGCGGPMSKLAVRADGVIVPCAQMPDMELGLINRDDLKMIWHEHPDLNRLRNRVHIPLSDFEFCRGCEYMDYCTGNCPAVASTMIHDAWRPSPDACYRKFLESGGNLPSGDEI
jgi:SynChlorMet cassette radical SAM/SPASM protein ScmE